MVQKRKAATVDVGAVREEALRDREVPVLARRVERRACNPYFRWAMNSDFEFGRTAKKSRCTLAYPEIR